MTALRMPHPPERLTSLAVFITQAFWVLAAGIVLMYGFFLLLGAIDPGDVAAVSIAVAALLVLSAARGWAGAHRAAQARDPRLVQARERRGF